MNRNEAIEKSAQLFLQVLEHNDNRLTDSVFDSINGLREALAMPKTDAFSRWENEEIQEALPKDAEPVACTYPSCQVTGGCVGSCKSPQYVSAPQADAERVALRDAMKRNDLIGRIDEVGDGENLEILLRDIRAYLGSDA